MYEIIFRVIIYTGKKGVFIDTDTDKTTMTRQN